MGRSTTPTFRIEYTCQGNRSMTPSTWGRIERRHVGPANQKNLAVYVDHMIGGFEPGEVNEHLHGTVIVEARLIHQASGEVRGTYRPSRDVDERARTTTQQVVARYGQVPVLLLVGGEVAYRGPFEGWVKTLVWEGVGGPGEDAWTDVAADVLAGLEADTPVIYEGTPVVYEDTWGQVKLVRYDWHDEHGPLVPEQGPQVKKNEDDWR